MQNIGGINSLEVFLTLANIRGRMAEDKRTIVISIRPC